MTRRDIEEIWLGIAKGDGWGMVCVGVLGVPVPAAPASSA